MNLARGLSAAAGMALRYLADRRMRAVAVTLTLALAFASYALLAAVGSPFGRGHSVNAGGAGEIGITAAYGGLPVRYANEIARMHGVRAVTYGNMISVPCRGGYHVSLNGEGAVGASVLANFASLGVRFSPAQRHAWSNARDGLLVGDSLARRCHWHRGQLLTLRPAGGRHAPFQVRVVGLFHSGKQPVFNEVALAHYAYVNSLKRGPGKDTADWMQARAADARAAPRLAAAIDAHFATRSPPTESSVNTTAQGALARYGNVLQLVRYVMAAVFLCTLLVTVNVAAHAAAERRRQFAVLRVLGFPRTVLVALCALELGALSTLGCGAGLGLGLGVLRWVLKPLFPPAVSAFWTPSASALWLAPVLAAGMAFVSLLIPAWEALRVRTAQLTAP